MVRLEGEALLRLLEIRRTLENDVVRKATLHASPKQRAEIARLCDILLVEVNAGRPWRKADHAFHGAIYDASGNPMYGQILTNLDHALERGDMSPFNRDAWKHRLLVAQGVLPADLILANGRVVDVFNETLIDADVAISRGDARVYVPPEAGCILRDDV